MLADVDVDCLEKLAAPHECAASWDGEHRRRRSGMQKGAFVRDTGYGPIRGGWLPSIVNNS